MEANIKQQIKPQKLIDIVAKQGTGITEQRATELMDLLYFLAQLFYLQNCTTNE